MHGDPILLVPFFSPYAKSVWAAKTVYARTDHAFGPTLDAVKLETKFSWNKMMRQGDFLLISIHQFTQNFVYSQFRPCLKQLFSKF